MTTEADARTTLNDAFLSLQKAVERTMMAKGDSKSQLSHMLKDQLCGPITSITCDPEVIVCLNSVLYRCKY